MAGLALQENKKFGSRYTEISVEHMHPFSNTKSSLDQFSCFVLGVRYCIASGLSRRPPQNAD